MGKYSFVVLSTSPLDLILIYLNTCNFQLTIALDKIKCKCQVCPKNVDHEKCFICTCILQYHFTYVNGWKNPAEIPSYRYGFFGSLWPPSGPKSHECTVDRLFNLTMIPHFSFKLFLMTTLLYMAGKPHFVVNNKKK